MGTSKVFDRVLHKLDVIDTKVSATPRLQMVFSSKLSPTVNALRASGGSASAKQVSELTGRSCARESAVLNELLRLGLATKRVEKGAEHHAVRIFTLKEVGTFEGEAVGGLRGKAASWDGAGGQAG
jgi:hypothetical protein